MRCVQFQRHMPFGQNVFCFSNRDGIGGTETQPSFVGKSRLLSNDGESFESFSIGLYRIRKSEYDKGERFERF
jgi:hypothetical protein